MTNDGLPNPTSPPTPDEESSLSGGLSSSKAAVEVPVLSEVASRAKLHPLRSEGRGGEECILSGVEEPVPLPREAVPGKTPPIKMDEDPVLSLSKEPPLQDEIDTMRCNLKHLIETFSSVETLKACPELVEGSISSSPPPSTSPPPAWSV